MLEEKHIDADSLLGSLKTVIRDVEVNGVVYVVEIRTEDTALLPGGMLDSEARVRFVIVPVGAPLRTFAEVYDEEYGWPVFVDLDQVDSVGDIAPGRRRHPLLCRESHTPVARSLMIGEYEDLAY